jgi:hypothetical protein
MEVDTRKNETKTEFKQQAIMIEVCMCVLHLHETFWINQKRIGNAK